MLREFKASNHTISFYTGSALENFTKWKGRLKKPLCTVAYTQRFEGGTGLNGVGGVNEVQ